MRNIYKEWYELICYEYQEKENLLELGSGASFLKDYIPNLITSDIFKINGIDLIADSQHIPLVNNSINGIIMIDVLHHQCPDGSPKPFETV